MNSYEHMITKVLHNDASSIASYFSCYRTPLEKSITRIPQRISYTDIAIQGEKAWWKLTSPHIAAATESRYVTRTDTKDGLGKHWLHTWGFFYMQEIAASLPARILPLQKNDIILDMCAAPWGKSVQLASRHFPSCFVVSNEVNKTRIISLQHNLNRTGMYNSCVTSLDGEVFGKHLPEFFDAVLVDAPCSGEGTSFKSPETTKRRREEDIHPIAHIQKNLLSAAIDTCKRWWYIVYSTCTLNPRENEGVVWDILKKYKGSVTLEHVPIPEAERGIGQREWADLLEEQDAKKVARFWPHIHHTWWFFIALFRKENASHTSDTPSIYAKASEVSHHGSQKKGQQSTLDMSSGLQTSMQNLLYDHYGIDNIPDNMLFIRTPKQIYVTTHWYVRIHNRIHIEKCGIPIFSLHKTWLQTPLHGLWSIFWHRAKKNVLTLTPDEAQAYSDWQEIATHYSPTTPDKYIMLRREKQGFSIGKIVNGYIKNKFAG